MNYGNSAIGLACMKHYLNWFQVPLYKVLLGLDNGNIHPHGVTGNFNNSKI